MTARPSEIDRGITRLLQRGDHRQAAVFYGWLDDIVQEFGDRIVPITVRVAREWGRQNAARPNPTVDALIAATAKVYGWTLVTRNTKDFEHADVQTLNPFMG